MSDICLVGGAQHEVSVALGHQVHSSVRRIQVVILRMKRRHEIQHGHAASRMSRLCQTGSIQAAVHGTACVCFACIRSSQVSTTYLQSQCHGIAGSPGQVIAQLAGCHYHWWRMLWSSRVKETTPRTQLPPMHIAAERLAASPSPARWMECLVTICVFQTAAHGQFTVTAVLSRSKRQLDLAPKWCTARTLPAGRLRDD